MENLMNLRWWSACIGVLVGEFLGDFDHLLYALVVFIAVDYITGVLCAVLDKNLSSEIGFQGIVRKVAIFLLVGVANVLDVHIIGGNLLLLVERGYLNCRTCSENGASRTEEAAGSHEGDTGKADARINNARWGNLPGLFFGAVVTTTAISILYEGNVKSYEQGSWETRNHLSDIHAHGWKNASEASFDER